VCVGGGHECLSRLTAPSQEGYWSALREVQRWLVSVADFLRDGSSTESRCGAILFRHSVKGASLESRQQQHGNCEEITS